MTLLAHMRAMNGVPPFLLAALVACTGATASRVSPPVGSGGATTCGPAAMLGTDQTLGDPAVELGPIWLVGFTHCRRAARGRPTRPDWW